MSTPGPSRNSAATANAAQHRQSTPRSTVAQTTPAGSRITPGSTPSGQAKKPAQNPVQAAQPSVQAAQAQARGPGTSVTKATTASTTPTGGAATAAATAATARTATPGAPPHRAQIPPSQPSQAQPPPAALTHPGISAGPGIPSDILHDLEFALYQALTEQKMAYVILGGVALQLLGSPRPTSEIDLFIPDRQSRLKTLKALGAYSKATAGAGKIGPFTHVGVDASATYNGLDGRRYKITVWQPAQIGFPFPEAAAKGAEEDGQDKTRLFRARVPKPAVLLNHKCRQWMQDEDAGDEKDMARDAGDILFLLGYMRREGLRTSRKEVDYATAEFFRLFFEHVPREKERLFREVGL